MAVMDTRPARRARAAARSGWPARAVAACAALTIGLLAVVLPASPASAHAVLQRTTPIGNSIVPAAPVEVLLMFSEPVSLVPGKVRVTGPDGQRADQGDPVVVGGVVSIPMRSDAPRGTYLVNYRVISADSHPVAGGFTYSVGAPSSTPPGQESQEATNGAVRTAVEVNKYVGYLGLVLIAGPALVLAALWPRRLSRRKPARLAWWGLGITGLSTVVAVLLQAPYTTGSTLTGITGADLSDVLGSMFGTVHIVRLGVLAAAAFLLAPLLAGRGGTADRALLAILAVVGVATWPLAGHPAASPIPVVTVLADAGHVASMAVWLGGLVMLVGFLLRWAREDELDAILPIWSRWAAAAVLVLLLCGTVSALVEVATPSALVSTRYGWLVLAKIGLFAAIVGVAAFSRKLVRDRMAPSQPGRLRTLVGIELGTAAVALAVASVLVQTTPARTDAANERLAEAQPYTATLESPLYSLQFDVDPAERGSNSIHLYAYDKAGRAVPVVEWRATAALPSAGVEPIQVPLLKITDNHAIGDISLPTAGGWEFRFTLRLSEIDQATVSTTVPIR